MDIVARECTSDEIAAMPSLDVQQDKVSVIISSPYCVAVTENGAEAFHVIGFVANKRVRLTSSIEAYDPHSFLVQTVNSVYEISAPLGHGPLPPELADAVAMLLLCNRDARWHDVALPQPAPSVVSVAMLH